MRRWDSPVARAAIGVRAAVGARLPDRVAVTIARAAHDRYDRRARRTVDTDPAHLQHHERSAFSQNGEDGIIAEIFRRIGTTNRTFVEIGAADGEENCTRALVEDGWSGLWVEGDDGRAAHARTVVGDRPVTVVRTLLEPDGAAAVLGRAGIPSEPDLLVIDIDGNDAWMWEAVGRTRRPRVVVMEVNGKVGPRWHWTLPYRPGRHWPETAEHGAGLAALAALGHTLGYVLVGCDRRGVNAFFVRADAAASFGPARSARAHWVPPRYVLPFGHPWRRPTPLATAPLADADADALTVRLVRPHPGVRRAGSLVMFEAAVHNGGSGVVGDPGEHPLRLVAWWEDEAGGRLDAGEPRRSVQPWRAAPGRTAHLLGVVAAPDTPGPAVLAVSLVQEHVRWLDDRPGCVARSPGWRIAPPLVDGGTT